MNIQNSLLVSLGKKVEKVLGTLECNKPTAPHDIVQMQAVRGSSPLVLSKWFQLSFVFWLTPPPHRFFAKLSWWCQTPPIGTVRNWWESGYYFPVCSGIKTQCSIQMFRVLTRTGWPSVPLRLRNPRRMWLRGGYVDECWRPERSARPSHSEESQWGFK